MRDTSPKEEGEWREREKNGEKVGRNGRGMRGMESERERGRGGEIKRKRKKEGRHDKGKQE